MDQVSSLKSLSLRVVADVVCDVVLKIRTPSLEQTLGIKLTSTLQQLNDYLCLPASVKFELSHVLNTQYHSDLFKMMLMIEIGFYCLDFQHYLHLNGSLELLTLLDSGKKTIRKLALYECSSDCLACNRFPSIETQEFLLTTLPYLQELVANGSCCNDYTLSVVAKHCPYLRKLKVKYSPGTTDQGIDFLCSEQSVTKNLMHLSLCKTNVTSRGAEKALKNLPRLETVECSTYIDTICLLKSLAEQDLVFAGYKDISIFITEETQEICKFKSLSEHLPKIFPNLCRLAIESEVSIDAKCFLFLRSLTKMAKLELTLPYYADACMSLFPCNSFQTNLHPQMKNLTKLCLYILDGVCIHSVLSRTPCLQFLTIQQVTDSGCTHSHRTATTINSSVLHLSLRWTGKTVVEKCLSLCPRVRTLALIDYDEMLFKINTEKWINLTHLSLDCLHMETAAFLVKNCKNLKVLNFIDQLPESEEAVVWFQSQCPFVKVMYNNIRYNANWFEDEKFSPCDLCQAYESDI